MWYDQPTNYEALGVAYAIALDHSRRIGQRVLVRVAPRWPEDNPSAPPAWHVGPSPDQEPREVRLTRSQQPDLLGP